MVEESAAAAPAMTPVKALIGVAVIMAVVALFLTVAGALHIIPYYCGFLFSLYLGAFEKMDPKAFVPSVVGSLGGVANAAALNLLPATMGNAGLAIALVVVLLSTFCLLMGWLKTIFNIGYMLFLTVATMPPLQSPPQFLGMAFAVLLGAAFMGVVLIVGGLAARGKAEAPA